MESFIATLALTTICNFFAFRRCREFKGASRGLYNYLTFVSSIGSLLTITTVILSCFYTTWWLPIVAYIVANTVAAIIPFNFWGELICAFLWPVFFIITLILIFV